MVLATCDDDLRCVTGLAVWEVDMDPRPRPGVDVDSDVTDLAVTVRFVRSVDLEIERRLGGHRDRRPVRKSGPM